MAVVSVSSAVAVMGVGESIWFLARSVAPPVVNGWGRSMPEHITLGGNALQGKMRVISLLSQLASAGENPARAGF